MPVLVLSLELQAGALPCSLIQRMTQLNFQPMTAGYIERGGRLCFMYAHGRISDLSLTAGLRALTAKHFRGLCFLGSFENRCCLQCLCASRVISGFPGVRHRTTCLLCVCARVFTAECENLNEFEKHMFGNIAFPTETLYFQNTHFFGIQCLLVYLCTASVAANVPLYG